MWKLPKIKYQNILIRLIDLWGLIKELVILFIAIIIFTLLGIIGFFYTLFKHLLVKRDYSLSKQFTPIVKALKLSIDGMSGVFSGEMLNDTLKPKYIKYGKWYHTISADTGINYIKGDDKMFRKLLDKVLGKKHCEKSITEEQKCLHKIKNYGINM